MNVPKVSLNILNRSLQLVLTGYIVLNIEFDKPEKNRVANGDLIFGQAIREARVRGTEVVLPINLVREPSLNPPEYIATPVADIVGDSLITGLINGYEDSDNITRRYALFWSMTHSPQVLYPTLAVSTLRAFYGFQQPVVPIYNQESELWNFGPLHIQTDQPGSQLITINWYGPSSSAQVKNSPRGRQWRTFPVYSLTHILDTDDYNLLSEIEDMDWMDQFLPGKKPQWMDSLSQSDTINSETNVSPFKDKIVMIGVSVNVAGANRSVTPFYNYQGIKADVPGVEVAANAVQTILDNNYIRWITVAPGNVGISLGLMLLIILPALLVYIVQRIVSPVVSLSVLVGLIVVYFGLVCGLFMGDALWMIRYFCGLILPVFMNSWFTISLPEPGESLRLPLWAPLSSLILTYSANTVYGFISERNDKRFYRDTFSTYIAPELIDQMFLQRTEPVLGGEAGYKTAFFTDIQDFSTFSEQLSPVNLVELLNEYLTAMTDILFEYRGTLDKYEGDAICAFFGAPLPMDDHVERACYTALEMQNELGRLRDKWQADGDKWPTQVHHMNMRIGINSGEMVVGNMGSRSRMNYTMMGDSVNLASRLESAAKQYGIQIHVGQRAQQDVSDMFEWRPIDYLLVIGKQQPVRTYELLGEKGMVSQEILELVQQFNHARSLYLQRRWQEAEKLFDSLIPLEPNHKRNAISPALVYRDRCRSLHNSPPPENWSGEWQLSLK